MTLFCNLLSDRLLITVSGDDSATFLQGLITNDIHTIQPGQGIYTLLLTPQGKYLYDFFITQDQDKYLIDCLKSAASSLIKKLTLYKLRSAVTIADVSEKSSIINIDYKPTDGIAYQDPRHPGMGWRVIYLGSAPELQWQGSYEARRIALGIPEGEKDLIADKSFPLEYGMDALKAIDFHKGCYVGQEVTARTKHRGSIRKAIFKVNAEHALPNPGTEVMAGGNKIGIMCSSYEHSGLALIRLEEYEQAHGCSFYAEGQLISLTPVSA